MAELVAVQSGYALFRAGEVGVIVDTTDLNPYDPQPLQAVLASGEWNTEVGDVEVPQVCFELADAALEGVETDVSLAAAGNDKRAVRVPKRVQEAAAAGYEQTRGYSEIIPTVMGLSRALASGTVTVETAKRAHAAFAAGPSERVVAALGGDACREWAAKVAGEAITADAAPVVDDAPTDDEVEPTDPNAPHEFLVMDPDAVMCVICGLPQDDPIHVPADATDDGGDDQGPGVTYFATFAPGGDMGPTFKVDSILAKDDGGAWWLREYGEWVPTQAPGAGDDIVQLDLESFNAAATQLDEPGTAYAELSLSEERLFELAEPHLNMDVLDAVFAAAPYIPPEVRSANAKKQMRDAKGHFIQQGHAVQDSAGDRGQVVATDPNKGTVTIKGQDGQDKEVPANTVTVDRNTDAPDNATGNPVARLAQPPQLVQDVKALVQQYQQKWAEEKGTNPMTAAGPDPLIPPDDPTPSGATPTSSGPSTPAPDEPAPDASGDPVADAGVTPLYLAEVDPQDTQAVLECLAVIPAKEQGDAISVYKRDGGAWVADPADQQKITGPTPPALVELDQSMLQNVMDQMDQQGGDAGGGDGNGDETMAAALRAIAAAGQAVMQRYELTELGLTASQVGGAKLLQPYGDERTWPTDIRDNLNEFLLGKEVTPGDVKNTDRLREYWTTGEGGAKIQWGRPGDWQRCVDHLGKYLGPRAKGYCTLRHHDATGAWPGHAPTEQVGHRGSHSIALVGEVQDEALTAGIEAVQDEDTPHDFVPYTGDSDFIDPDECDVCGRAPGHPLHVVVVMLQGADDPEPDQSHEFTPGPEGVCECGKPVDDPIHTATTLDDPMQMDDESDYTIRHTFVPFGDGTECDCGRPAEDAMHEFSIVAAAAAVAAGERFRIPLVVPEGIESGDGRSFAKGALSSRPMPLALMWQPEGDEGHKGAVIVGRIDHVERLPEGGLGNAYGVFDTGPWGREALRLVKAGMLRGISADLDEFEADVLTSGEDGAEEGGPGEGGGEKISAQKLLVNKGRLMGITLVAKPAFAECTIMLDGEGDEDVPDGEYIQETGEARVAALVAAAAPLHPPADWFKNPGLSKPTHLTVDDDGRVYGHIAAWDVDHIGLPFGTRAPRSASGYAYFRTGSIRTAEGTDVPVGQLTLTGGHAPLKASAQEAVKHYDDTASAVADLAAGEDQYGIWVSGALRPGVTPEQVRALRASSPSGDWRPIKGRLELVAVCQVNVPGFPVARAMVASGQVTALVAAGALTMEPVTELTKDDIDRRIAVLEAAEARRLEQQARELRERMTPALNQRHEALAASAAQARERVDKVRAEHRAKLEEQAAELKARVAAGGLHVAPFDETKHPRDGHGRFRQVLARLESMLKGEHAAKGAIQKVEDAAAKEDAGDHKGAVEAAREAGDKLAAAAKSASGDVKARLSDAAKVVHDAATGHEAGDPLAELEHDDAAEVLFDQLAEPVKEQVRLALTRAEEKLNPGDVDPQIERLKKFISAHNPMNPRDLYHLIKNQLRQAATPPTPRVAPQNPVAPGNQPGPQV